MKYQHAYWYRYKYFFFFAQKIEYSLLILKDFVFTLKENAW